MRCEPDRCSVESADLTLPSTPSTEQTQHGSAKQTAAVEPSSKDIFPALPSSKTSGKSETPNRLTSCTEAIPVSHSPKQDSGSEKKIIATSGPSLLDAFAYYDQDSSSWKTCQGTLLSDSTESSPTWPKQGMTRGGYAYELVMSALPTGESASSLLLQTPTAEDSRASGGAASRDRRQTMLHHQARELLATPTTSDAKGPSPGHTGMLAEHIALLPTPSAYESTPTDEFVEDMKEADIRPDRRLYMPGRKWHAQRTLSRVAPALLPTPGANDMTGGEGETRRSRQEQGTGGPALRDINHLLPTPQAQHAGETTNLPSENGSSLQESQPPDQLTIADA